MLIIDMIIIEKHLSHCVGNIKDLDTKNNTFLKLQTSKIDDFILFVKL